MKTLNKIILIAFILVFCSFSYVQAIDMFLTSSSNNNIASAVNENNEIIVQENIANTNVNTVSNSVPISSAEATDVQNVISSTPVITTTSNSNNELTISDIINIILISVCVVLIFLGIAILIKCK